MFGSRRWGVATPIGTFWTPLKLQGLVGFWRSDIGVTLSGSNVTGWADQTASANNLIIEPTSPTYSATGFNSAYPGISFAGSSTQGLTCNTTSTLASSKRSSCWALLTINSGVNNGRIISFFAHNGNDSTTPGFDIFDNFPSGAAMWSSGQLSEIALTPPVTLLMTSTFDGANSITWNNANSATPVAFTGTVGGSGNMTLGNDSATSANITVAAAGFCSSYTMNASDITNLRGWCNKTFGTNV